MTPAEMMATFDRVQWKMFCWTWRRIGERHGFVLWLAARRPA